MDKKLEDLVDGVDRAARNYATFADFQKAQEEKGGTEWQKPVDGAVENSSSSSPEKVGETAESSPSPSVEAASEPVDAEKPTRKTREILNKVYNGTTERLAHPMAPNVTSTDEPAGKLPGRYVFVPDPQETKTRMVIHKSPWDGETLLHAQEETEIRTSDPEWLQQALLMGQEAARKVGSDPERIADEVINRYYERIEIFQKAIQGARGVLENALIGKSLETQNRVRAKASGQRSARNEQAASRMKKEREPKPKAGVGIKLADETAKLMPKMRGDKLIKFLKEEGLCDDLTIKYVNEKWGAK